MIKLQTLEMAKLLSGSKHIELGKTDYSTFVSLTKIFKQKLL